MTTRHNRQAEATPQLTYTELAAWTRWAPWTSTRKTTWHRAESVSRIKDHQPRKTLCGHVIPGHAQTFGGSVPADQECKCCRDVQQRRRAREQAMATGKRYLTHRERVSPESEQRYYL